MELQILRLCMMFGSLQQNINFFVCILHIVLYISFVNVQLHKKCLDQDVWILILLTCLSSHSITVKGMPLVWSVKPTKRRALRIKLKCINCSTSTCILTSKVQCRYMWKEKISFQNEWKQSNSNLNIVSMCKPIFRSSQPQTVPSGEMLSNEKHGKTKDTYIA